MRAAGRGPQHAAGSTWLCYRTRLKANTRDAPADVRTTNLVDFELTPAVDRWAIVESSNET